MERTWKGGKFNIKEFCATSLKREEHDPIHLSRKRLYQWIRQLVLVTDMDIVDRHLQVVHDLCDELIQERGILLFLVCGSRRIRRR